MPARLNAEVEPAGVAAASAASPSPSGSSDLTGPPKSVDLKGLSKDALAQLVVESLGEPRYRSDQIYRWLHRGGARSFEEMRNLPKALRARLAEISRISGLEVAGREVSKDGTRKYRLKTETGDEIESVLIPEGARRTLCISSQVGCAMGCRFCLTATMGLKRNLGAGEIVDQVSRVRADLEADPEAENRITNIVMMGMGEPLHNYDNVVAAVRLLTDADAYEFSHRRVTVSTVGLAQRIERFGHDVRANLAVSLTGSCDAQRDEVMPVNKRFPIEKLLEACRAYPLEMRKRITFEYVLLKDFNDSPEDAERLAKLLGSLRCKVNVLPFNAWEGAPYERPDDETVERFSDRLHELGVCSTVRRSRGRDISAACGQLVTASKRQRRPAPPASSEAS